MAVNFIVYFFTAQEEQVPDIDEGDFWLVKYDELAQKTRCIPLSHLGTTFKKKINIDAYGTFLFPIQHLSL